MNQYGLFLVGVAGSIVSSNRIMSGGTKVALADNGTGGDNLVQGNYVTSTAIPSIDLTGAGNVVTGNLG